MNAVTPAVTPLALQNEGLLRAIAEGGHASSTALANAAGVIGNNLSRKLEALQNEGLITWTDGAPTHEPHLTEQGERALAALDRLHGPAEAAADTPNGVRLRHDQIERDPDNARTHSGLDGEEFGGFVASIREKGILEKIVVRRLDGDRFRLVKGERRHRAWAWLVERGDWPADHTEEVAIVDGSEEEIADLALIDNLQRSNLDNLEKADAFFLRHKRFGLTPQQMAQRYGVGDRHVQELLRVAEKATPEAKLAYWDAKIAGARETATDAEKEAARRAWTVLRESVKQPRHVVELEKNARLRLLVVELAARAVEEIGQTFAWVQIARPTPGGVSSTAVELQLIQVDIQPALIQARLLPFASEWLLGQLTEDEGPRTLLAATRTEALGPMGAAAVPDEGWGIDFLNPPPPPPPPPVVPTTALPVEDAPSPAPDLSGTAGGGASRGATAFVGDDLSQAIRRVAAESEQDQAGGDPEPLTDTAAPPPPPAPEPAPLTLEPKLRLTIIEIAHKVEHHGQETRGGAIRGAPVGAFHTHREYGELLNLGLCGFVQAASGNSYLVTLTQVALDYLAREGFAHGVTAEDVARTQEETLTAGELGAIDRAQTPYFTPWLYIPPPPKKAAATPPAAAQPPARDPIIDGLRTSFADLADAADKGTTLLARVLSGEGVGDDELGLAIDALQRALERAKPYLPREPAS